MMSPEHVDCDICGKTPVKILLSGEDMHFGFQGKFHLCECQRCGLVYLNPRPTKREMFEHYPEKVYDAWQPADRQTKDNCDSNIKGILRSAWRVYIKLMRGTDLWLLGEHRGKVLDVGCGSGGFIKKLKGDGWETRGLDISPVATEHARGLGLDVFTGELHEAHCSDKCFDVIVMRHVLEHLHNPSDVLKEVRRVLKDDGFLQVEVPNFGSVEAKIFKKYWYPLELPRHLYHFTIHTLKLTLEKSGFSITRVNYGTEPGGITESLNYLTRKGAVRFWEHFIITGIVFLLSSIAARLNKGTTIIVRAEKVGESNNSS